MYRFDDAIKIYQQAKPLFPNNINLIIDHAIALQSMGNFDAAFKLLKDKLKNVETELSETSSQNTNTSIRKNSTLLMLLLTLARCAAEAGDTQQAEQYYQTLLTYDPKNKLGRLGHIRLLEEQNLLPQANTECDQLLTLYPHDASLWLTKARVLEKMQQFDEAEIILTDSEKTPQVNVEIKLATAHCLELQANKTKDAEKLFASLSNNYPHILKAKLSYAVFLWKHSDRNAAKRLFVALTKNSPYFISARLKYAEFLIDNCDYNTAIIEYKRTLQIFPYCTKAIIGLARCHATRGATDTAIQLLALKENQEKLKYAWDHYYDLADYYLQTNHRDQAETLYEKAKKQFPSHRKLLTVLEKKLALTFTEYKIEQPTQPISSPPQTHENVLNIAKKLEQYLSPYEIRVCGSCTRDDFSSDIDIVTCAPAIMIALIPNVKIFEIKNDYLTKQGIYLFKAIIDGVSIDIRTRNRGKTNIAFDDASEMKKSDFTINERLLKTDGTVIASEQSNIDLEAGIVRATGELSEIAKDPIRMLRAVTLIAQKGFKLEPELADYIKKNATFIEGCPIDVLAKRLAKILNQPFANTAIESLRALGLLEQPTIAKLWQQKQMSDKTIQADPPSLTNNPPPKLMTSAFY